MSALHNGSATICIAPNLWAGVGLVRGGAGTALWAIRSRWQRIREYQALGSLTLSSPAIRSWKAHRFADLVMPLLPLASNAQPKRAALIPGRSVKPSAAISAPSKTGRQLSGGRYVSLLLYKAVTYAS